MKKLLTVLVTAMFATVCGSSGNVSFSDGGSGGEGGSTSSATGRIMLP